MMAPAVPKRTFFLDLDYDLPQNKRRDKRRLLCFFVMMVGLVCWYGKCEGLCCLHSESDCVGAFAGGRYRGGSF